MTPYLSHIHDITGEACDTADDSAQMMLTAASAGAILLAGLRDAFDRGGLPELQAQMNADVAATAKVLAMIDQQPDVQPFTIHEGGRA